MLNLNTATLKIGAIQILREIFYLIMLPVDLLVPKKRTCWLFATHPGYPWGDNIRAVFEYARQDEGLEAVILCADKASYEQVSSLYGTDVVIHRRYTLAGIWLYLRSYVCFIGYTNKDLYSMLIPHAGHVIVNLWHGVPLKSICLARPQFKNRHRKILNPAYIHADLVIANSPMDRLAMSACMMQNPNNVIVTGLPRNDMLSETFTLYPDVIEEDRALKAAKAGEKLVLYAPTFREWEDAHNPFAKKETIAEIARALALHGYKFGMRLHPLEKNIAIPGDVEIIDCNSANFKNTQVVLRNTDILISDYSSIWIDYLILNRPVIGFCYDKARYEADRSTLYAFDSVFPGPVAEDIEQLTRILLQVVQGENADHASYMEKAPLTKNLLHYSDACSTQRVVEAVKNFGR